MDKYGIQSIDKKYEIHNIMRKSPFLFPDLMLKTFLHFVIELGFRSLIPYIVGKMFVLSYF